MSSKLVEQLEFDFSFGCPCIEAEYYREGAQDLIRKILPPELLDPSAERPAAQRARFADILPVIRWSDLDKAPCSLSVLMLCRYRLNACNFFCDMISKWLLPRRQVNVELFFSSDVRLPHLSDELLSVAEVVVYLKSASEVEEVRRNLQSVETEIRLGVVSNYHARRILEFKGLSSDGKTAMIQEKISSLINNHSKDFDQGIFSQMQQFLVNCPDDFKKARDYHHMSRMISNLYSVRKLLQQNIAVFPEKRHVILKFLKTRVASKQGSKPVLGILAGLNFLREHELFEEEHLAAAVKQLLPATRLVRGSCIVDPIRESSFKTTYLEMEKEDGSDFLLQEIQSLKNGLEGALKGNIEQLTHPIYMPRNEEEVLRNIVALSGQIRSVKDLPQVIISFDETRGADLYFTVILLRICTEKDPSVQELFAKSKTDLKYIPDRIRKIRSLRHKYTKEAVVFRTFLSSHLFLRSNHSVDLYKVRTVLFNKLCAILGDLRDYNGGMILKQTEQLAALKTVLGKTAQAQSILVEKFFHAIAPIEMRTSCAIEPLKQLFLMLLTAVKKETPRLPFAGSDFLFKQEADKVLAVIPNQRTMLKTIEALKIPAHLFVSVVLEINEVSYLSILLLSSDKALQSAVLASLRTES
jgi:hypothetical protein